METDVGVEDKRKFAQAQAFENRELGVNEQQKMVGRAMETLAGNPGPVLGAVGSMPFPGMAGGNIVQPSTAGTAEMARMLLNQQSEQPAPMDAATAQPAQESFEQRAKKVKFLLDNGMITQEQYQAKINQLMSEI